jgi:hypothetical protein
MPRVALAFLIALLALGCEPSTQPADPRLPPPNSTLLDGTWRAIYWTAQPPDDELMDVWELGGRLDLVIAKGAVTGTMHVPADVSGGAPLDADMAGVVLVAGDSARFEQPEDTFVRRATWRIDDDALFIVDHDVEGTRFSLVLVRGW